MEGGGDNAAAPELAEDQEISHFNEEDQKQLDQDKRKIRLDNERYLRQHPEIAMITSVVTSEVLKAAPSDPVAFVAEFMTAPNLKERVLQAGSMRGIVPT
mmetsp:Transcript_23076/g.56886  ORF Transcript_23076/g.56886 Transcript_23076/m.56886 type:complete len:100 (+) Transcript_23076:15-314(+)|eukprot:CAMPEP_0206247180 /NCGR_PEP_ID=MMETSP0047_2-20121206/19669_1 /ASSEMBLY_ACC=CAM_ASM_000192 /TAXON_ID=195065 /ORGANISM="Chroomonas mesostigmatica_cf, Strain CCMP1168" /LENGTH=99 /DNA_ID=CAMNT_0053672681 /DNA_START=15 /DNA_END=314 /DNA_ORIENTATION=-